MEYNLTAVATNDVGSSESVEIDLLLHTVPEIVDLNVMVYPWTTSGMLVGKLDMGIDNNSTLTDIYLSGSGSEYFSVDADGIIRVAEGYTLENSEQSEFDLVVTAWNIFGLGSARVVITVLDGEAG